MTGSIEAGAETPVQTIRVRFIRTGVELATHRPAMGELVALPRFQAEALVRHSAAVVEEEASC